MNRLGMMVDISHVADKTFWDVAGHQYGAHDRLALLLPRALQCSAQHDGRDDRCLAKKGGVIQINFNCGFLSEKSAEAGRKVPSSDLPGSRGDAR